MPQKYKEGDKIITSDGIFKIVKNYNCCTACCFYKLKQTDSYEHKRKLKKLFGSMDCSSLIGENGITKLCFKELKNNYLEQWSKING